MVVLVMLAVDKRRTKGISQRIYFIILVDTWMDLSHVVVDVDCFKTFGVEVLYQNFWNSIPLAVDSDKVLEVVEFCDYEVLLLAL